MRPRIDRPPTTAAIVLTALLGLLALTGLTAAEEPAGGDDDPGLAAMARLSELEGRWKGSGWMRRGPGEPHRFDGTETVAMRLDGRVLVIEGEHRAAGTDQVVHHAMAVVSWDEEAGEYRFRSYLANGREGDFTGRFEDGAFVWGMELPGQQIRYTIRFGDDRWLEIGERSADGGESWQKFFEMDLARAGASG